MNESPAQLDAATVRSLVEEVLRRIAAAGSGGVAAEPRPVNATGVAIADPVITLAHVERLQPGIREISVSARAVVTPSARDRAREKGVTLVRGSGTPAAAAAARRPFVIAQADGNAAARAAAIARAIPGSQRLPATGLADVVASLALQASRDAARGVLLTSRPALALVVANRAPSLRAATGGDAATLAAAATECAANLLVIDPAVFRGGLDRCCVEFAGRPAVPVPAELAGAPAGCACQSHPH